MIEVSKATIFVSICGLCGFFLMIFAGKSASLACYVLSVDSRRSIFEALLELTLLYYGMAESFISGDSVLTRFFSEPLLSSLKRGLYSVTQSKSSSLEPTPIEFP